MDLKPKGLFKRVFDFAISEIDRRSRPPQRFSSAPSPPASVDAPEEPVLRAPPIPVEGKVPVAAEAELPLEVSRQSSGAVMVRWALTEGDVALARPLASEQAALSLRLVAFSTAGSEVRREVLDLPAATLSGYVTLQRAEHERLVVSVGLLDRESFVSIVHAQLG